MVRTPWNNLTKEIALARSVNSFKSKLGLYLGNLSRNNLFVASCYKCGYRAISGYRSISLETAIEKKFFKMKRKKKFFY